MRSGTLNIMQYCMQKFVYMFKCCNLIFSQNDEDKNERRLENTKTVGNTNHNMFDSSPSRYVYNNVLLW